MLSNKDTFEQQAQSLECHFSWNLQNDMSSYNANTLEAKLKTDAEGNPDLKIKVYLLLSYAFTVKDTANNYDLEKALYYVNTALDETTDEGERLVARANKLNILFMQRDPAAKADLTPLKKYRKAKSTLASIALIEAYTISECQLERGMERGMELCEKAISLSPYMGEAYYYKSLFIGRIRKGNSGPAGRASDEELIALRTSIQYWPTSPLPCVFYALALASELLDNNKRADIIAEMDAHLETAMRLSAETRHGTALMRCAKGYRYLARLEKRKYVQQDMSKYVALEQRAIKKALQICPNRTTVLHEAALTYWKSTPKLIDLDKAEHYLREACNTTTSTFNNSWVDIDLVRIQQEKDPACFDAYAGYVQLLPKYANDPKSKQAIHIEIGGELVSQNKLGDAIEEFKTAFHLLPHSIICLAKLSKAVTIEKKQKYEQHLISAAEYIKLLLELAETFELFEPKKLHAAEKQYREIIRVDPSNRIAQSRLRNIGESQLRRQFSAISLGDDNEVDSKTDISLVQPSARKFYDNTKHLEDVYKMTSNPRGYAIIVNITKDREGAVLDEINLEKLLRDLKYEVIVLRDKTRQEILGYFEKVSTDERLKTHDSIAIFCMAHGQKDDIIVAKQQRLRYTDIFDIFRKDVCPALSGKPKLYFIQACRGVLEETQVRGKSSTEQSDIAETPEASEKSAIPVATHSDMLISYATVDGFKAYRDTHGGSRYITALVDVFREHAKDTDVLGLLTKVNYALHKRSGDSKKFSKESHEFEINMQCAEKTDTLTKNLYFFPGF